MLDLPLIHQKAAGVLETPANALRKSWSRRHFHVALLALVMAACGVGPLAGTGSPFAVEPAFASSHEAAQLRSQAEQFRRQGRYADAAEAYKQALTLLETKFGRNHPSVASTLVSLAAVYRLDGRPAEAESALKRALAIRQQALGPNHPEVATTLNTLAGLLRAQGRAADAEPLAKRAVSIGEKNAAAKAREAAPAVGSEPPPPPPPLAPSPPRPSLATRPAVESAPPPASAAAPQPADAPQTLPKRAAQEAERRAEEAKARQGGAEAARSKDEAVRSAAPKASPPAATGTARPSASAPVPAPEPGATRGGASPAAGQRWDVVPVFYGTDRAAVPGPERVASASSEPGMHRASYGHERARRLEIGRALVTVPKSHEVPLIERPWVYRLPFSQIVLFEEKEDATKHFTLKEVKALSRDEFTRLVRERLGVSRGFKDHALVFIHGFNTSFEAALFRTAQVAYDLEFDGAPFVYSWPSKGAVGLGDYGYDRESAGQAEPHVRAFLELVVRETGAKNISIIAHSMGSQVLLPALRSLKATAPEGVAISQIILAAPDVDKDGFEFLANEIRGIAKGVTLYAAANDRALRVSRQFWGGVPRAGDVAAGPIVVQGVDTIDVTTTSTAWFALNHSGYAEKSALLSDIQRLIQTGERPPESRVPILERIKTAKGDYWRYP